MHNATCLITLTALMSLVGACSSGHENAAATPPSVLADTDGHGCENSVGYQWSAVQRHCVRLAEAGIKLASTTVGDAPAAYLLFASPDDDREAEVFLPGEPGRVLPKVPGEGAGSWTLDTLTLSHWKGMYSLGGARGTVRYEGHIEAEVAVTDAGESLLPAADVPTMLAGTWYSVDDTNERFTVEGKTLTRYYEGKKRLALTFAYVPNCGGTACAGHQSPYGCITTAGKFDIDCQTIAVITTTELALSMGSTEKVMRYQKDNSR